MSDIRYDQYSAGTPYSPYEKRPNAYSNSPNPVGNYYANTGMNIPNGRVASKQGMGIPEQMRGGQFESASPKPSSQARKDETDSVYSYGSQSNPAIRSSSRPLYQQGAPKSADPMNDRTPVTIPSMNLEAGAGNVPPRWNDKSRGNMPPEVERLAKPDYSDYEREKARYKLFPSALSDSQERCTWYNYVLPSCYSFPKPPFNEKALPSFDAQLLVYLFYEMPRDRLQLLAAQQLYSRDYVYHKAKKIWYKKDKVSANYTVCNCCECFSFENWTFIPCSEVFKNAELLSQNELNEYTRKL